MRYNIFTGSTVFAVFPRSAKKKVPAMFSLRKFTSLAKLFILSLGARNSHTEPMSRHFYSPVFLGLFSAKYSKVPDLWST